MGSATLDSPEREAPPRPTRRARTIAFYAIAGALSFGLVVAEWWTLTLPVLMWFPDSVVDDFYSQQVEHGSTHRVHLMAKGLAHVVITCSIVLQLRRTASREAQMLVVSGFFLVAITVNAIAGHTTDNVPLGVWILFGFGVILGLLHPSSPIRKRPRLADPRQLTLTAAMAIPFGVYAMRELDRQVNGVAADPHWTEVHYIFTTEIGVLLVLMGVVSSFGFTGRRMVAWMAGGAAVLMGASSAVYTDQTSSLGVGWGLALAVWGVVFVAVDQGGRTSSATEQTPDTGDTP